MRTVSGVKTQTLAIFPILIALSKFKDLGINRFIPVNEKQAWALSLLGEALSVNYSEDDITALASKSIAELNSLLEKKGFDIRLNEDADMGVVTIMDLFGEWLSEASETTIQYEDTTYPAMVIKEGASLLTTKHGEEILKIRTKSGLTLFIHTNVDEPVSDVELHMATSKARIRTEEECRATIPFVTVDQQPDISWITGMVGEGTDMVISQALQQNRLKINPSGIRAESAVAVAVRKGISLVDKSYVVDQPFNIWLSYDDNPFPLFAAYVAPESWKK